ncbi:MAG: phosphate ABC transporter permease subunit PstC [Moorea sp. SIO4G2]|uniref:phosphate ABC transporter permease subunit PstC n=1 Tax=unclassified Moorena TaxID=2683338 RepID=UPI0013F91D97|nr:MULTISPECIES: phosphate ABC transporter permease subunit PstC [unclassified Moorena]NEO11303.1 phosphate ABC transporter permease subunit PstC [Moorena sp. SIO3E8]NEO51569.1 phosphate ABC transporter permease subunit PstC [Moorena sp. SIO4A3]NEO64570.1 phosphate ABC transporter permease subunit PstC [Moorena sp. SIO4G2]NEP97855.1 phosphate ABC transporter permease subunit PstC [Moorena sp. SIO3F7]
MSTTPSSFESSDSEMFRPNRQLNKRVELVVKIIFATFAFVSVATTIGIVLTLIFETVGFFQEVSLWKQFLTDKAWTPLFANPKFGIFVLISATFLTSVIALMVALPLGLLAAICLSEYASSGVRRWIKPALEILAGVPTVVFGYFALMLVSPFLRRFIPELPGFNALSAGIVLGIAIIPMIASLSEDAIYAVPNSLRQGAYALGATKRETIIGVVIPAALSGIVASFVLAVSRAVGETMIVSIAAGQNPTLGLNPLVPVMTMTASIVQVSMGDTPAGSLAYKTIFSVGMTLFLLTLALNIFSFWFVRRFREKYD